MIYCFMKHSILSAAIFALCMLTHTSSLFAQDRDDAASIRVVEDGGTGAFRAIMYTDSSLDTHPAFRPENLEPFGQDHLLPIIAGGSGACVNAPREHVHVLSEVGSHGFLVIAIG